VAPDAALPGNAVAAMPSPSSTSPPALPPSPASTGSSIC
jgi:hypothetical protein